MLFIKVLNIFTYHCNFNANSSLVVASSMRAQAKRQIKIVIFFLALTFLSAYNSILRWHRRLGRVGKISYLLS